MKEKFSNIEVYEEGPFVWARGAEARILFRFCKLDGTFSIFRSPRMQDDEKEFCLLMFRRLADKRNLLTEDEILKVLCYSIRKDIYCV